MSLMKKSVIELQSLIQNKEVSVKELTEAALAQTESVEQEVQAFITVTKEEALARAEQLDNADSKEGALFGIPAGIKDNIVTKDIATTCASKMLENFVPVYDATVVTKLNEAGAVSLGKLNLDEFAMGSTTETSAMKQTRNPWNTAKVPGGSSGGSAAAVAANEVAFALGTDTGGSVRQPAAFCGIVGMKPTYGRVSRLGLVAFASSFDQIGPMTKTVADNALVLQTIAGEDRYDTTSATEEVPNYVARLDGNLKGLKIAMPKEFFGEGLDPQVKEKVEEAIKQLEALGATVDEVSIPHVVYGAEMYAVIAYAEASSNLARYDGIHFGYRSPNATNLDEVYTMSRAEAFGPEVKKRLLFGTYALSAEHHDPLYVQAQKVRTLMTEDVQNVLKDYDIIVGPSAASVAYDFKAQADPARSRMDDILATPANLAGIPALSVPCGFVDGLPVGLQLMGKHFDELTLYQVAHAYEQTTKFYEQQPQLAGGANA